MILGYVPSKILNQAIDIQIINRRNIPLGRRAWRTAAAMQASCELRRGVTGHSTKVLGERGGDKPTRQIRMSR